MAHDSAVATGAGVGVLATDVAGATGAAGAAGWAYYRVNNRSKYQKTVGKNNAKTKIQDIISSQVLYSTYLLFCM